MASREFHPDLRRARFIPPISFGPRLARVMQRVKPPAPPVPDDLTIENVEVPGLGDNPPISLRFYRPRAVTG